MRSTSSHRVGEPKSLARKQHLDTRAPAIHRRRRSIALRDLTNIIWQNPTMTRDDLLLRLFDCLVCALFGATVWTLLSLCS